MQAFSLNTFNTLVLLLLWMLTLSLHIATDVRGSDGGSQQKLLSRFMGASGCQAWRPEYLPTSTSNIDGLLQGWCQHCRRIMASVDEQEVETDYLGDYSPTPNVDRGAVAPLPSPIHGHSMIGNKRKLFQDYSPMANTNNPSPSARH